MSQYSLGIYTALLVSATTTGPGPYTYPNAVSKSFQAIITGTASVQIQGSNDPDLIYWVTLQTITTTGGYDTAAPYLYFRANVASITSGTVSVHMGT